jgi:hypothetical protein
MDSVWAYKQRLKLTLYLWTLGSILLALYFGIKLYKPPTCYDGKENQHEVGVDCGGECSLMCETQTQALSTVWALPFRVSEGWWSALAYVENPNLAAYAKDVPYRFQFYDKDGLLIASRTGSTFITSDPTTPIFVGRVATEKHVPHRVTFEWLSAPKWHRYQDKHRISFEEQQFSEGYVGYDLTVTAHNQEPYPISQLEAVAIVYDTEGNVMQTSQTFVDTIGPRAKRSLTFSWPEAFPAKPGRVEFIARVPAQD